MTDLDVAHPVSPFQKPKDSGRFSAIRFPTPPARRCIADRLTRKTALSPDLALHRNAARFQETGRTSHAPSRTNNAACFLLLRRSALGAVTHVFRAVRAPFWRLTKHM